VTVTVRVTPRAARDAIESVDAEGTLRVRVRAAPVDGAANEALRQLLAAELGLRTSAVEVVRGATARRKVIRIDGVGAAALLARWPGLAIAGRHDG
jgi:uncharacterized protein (TIGR00251 family)